MVKVAIAGGSGPISREVIDALVASKKHDIIILSRQVTPTFALVPGVEWQAVDYTDRAALAAVLQGVHTVLSFVQTVADHDQTAQKDLIDAAIAAGVKRFAPSEFGSKGAVNMPWYQPKLAIREYLEEVNKTGDVIEYTLFQPGLFLDYLAFPYQTARYLKPLETVFDFCHRRAMVVAGHEEDAVMTLTTVADLAAIVARAVAYEGRWPRTSGVVGNRLTFARILEIGEKVRGRPFTIDKVNMDDLEAGDLKTTWGLQARHPSIPEDEAAAMLKQVAIGVLLSSAKGAWDSSDEMNRLFPDYRFTAAAEFLADVWEGKP
ncbi:hypothetical protein F4778DRAFT_778952 [Xylariomycetidae sp. FL2044]|nr:hypothetical protein F4778DRAFT_778952 [Xylariomycetidae sp. FL2044]